MSGLTVTIARCKGDSCDTILNDENCCDDYRDMCLWCCNCFHSDGVHKH